MTNTANEQAEQFSKWRRPLVIGAGVLMFGLIFGAGMATAFYILNEYPGWIGSVAAGVMIIASGILLRIAAHRLLRIK